MLVLGSSPGRADARETLRGPGLPGKAEAPDWRGARAGGARGRAGTGVWDRPAPRPQQSDPDRHWRWVSSTYLLCYGQMALHAREQILPWVDNIISRMVYYFSCSCYVSP